MSLTIANIISNLDSFIGDTSNDRISAAERLQYITEGTVWLQESLENDTQISTYTLNYYDGVHSYKVNNVLADLLEGADLRRGEEDQIETFAHKSSREMAEEIGQWGSESSWSIELRDGNKFIVVNHQSKHESMMINDCDSLIAGGGTWTLDTTNGDGTNLTVDTNEYKIGSSSLNFDIDVSQTANNKAILYNSTLTNMDLSSYEELAAFIFWVYIPDITYFSSITLYWGSDSSNYWSATVTTDMNGTAWANGWNRVAVMWSNATKTSSPDASAIDYIKIDFNYTASQADDTDFRIDDLKICRPEPLTFYYISWNVGTDTTGATGITSFTATSDIPYFSGQYDQYKFAVAHKAASLIYKTLRLKNESDDELLEAMRALQRAKNIIPSSKNPEMKNFKVRGISFARGYRGRGSRFN